MLQGMKGNESTFLQPAACVLSLLGQGKLREQSDLVFHCSDGKVSSHRLLLAAMSSYLAELLLSVQQELLPAVILLPGTGTVLSTLSDCESDCRCEPVCPVRDTDRNVHHGCRAPQ